MVVEIVTWSSRVQYTRYRCRWPQATGSGPMGTVNGLYMLDVICVDCSTVLDHTVAHLIPSRILLARRPTPA